MVEMLRPAQFVQHRQVILHRAGQVVVPQVDVDHPVGPALGAGPVVGHGDDQRVVEGVDALEEVEQAPDVVVGVLQKTGVHLHHARIDLALVRRALAPGFDIGIVARQLGVGGNDTQFLLAGKDLLAIGIPAVIELALVFVGPFLGHMMRRVHGAGGEIEEERLVGHDLLGIGDKADGLVDQILGEMVALFRRLLRLDLVVVVDQLRVILVRVAAQEAVEALEPAAQRPAVIRSGRRHSCPGVKCHLPTA